MKTIYVFSGLGVDRRVFDKILWPGNVEVCHVDWIPVIPKESLQEYAYRLSENICAEQSILVGLSFGGIVAQEVAKNVLTSKVVLLASLKEFDRKPCYLTVLRYLPLHRFIPVRFFKWHNRFLDWIFGITSLENSKMLKQILKDTDPVFLKWAIDKIISWKPTGCEAVVQQIHGAEDKIFPLKNCSNPDIVITKAGHFMTIENYKQVSIALAEIIEG